MRKYNIDRTKTIDALAISNSTKKLLIENRICTIYELVNKSYLKDIWYKPS